MEPPPLGRRVFTRSGSGDRTSLMDDDVVEIPPPPSFVKSKSFDKKQKQKQVTFQEIIDVDNDEDQDLMVFEDKFVYNSKGKSSVNGSRVDVDSTEAMNLSEGLGSTSHSLSSGDEIISNMSSLYDYNGDLDCNGVIIDDECAMLQAHFDSLDVPPGVEAAIPWWLPSEGSKSHGVSASTLAFVPPSSVTNVGPSKLDDSQPSRIYNETSPTGIPSVKAKRKPFSTSSSRVQPYNAPWKPTPLYFQQNLDAWTSHPASASVEPPLMPYPSNAPFGNLLPAKAPLSQKYSFEASWWNAPSKLNVPASLIIPSSLYEALPGGFVYYQDSSLVLDHGIAAEISGSLDIASSHEREALIVKKLESFKKFDTVQDHRDHHYSSMTNKQSQPSKGWVKKIQEEWRILEKDLPDTILVRVYETRMDLLRAVIIGAEGTPYHDGIFFFDVHFPSSYPNVPPLVYYRSGGLRLNPNLYDSGKVCLSLLNTWNGYANEKWVPGFSTTLQILVSIQGLILNSKPFFNEPGYVDMQGSPAGEKQSEVYNESAFLLSLKTMLYSMRQPPKYFEDFVFGHFFKKAHEILMACKAYLDGAQIGTLVKGGIQDVDAGNKSCSNTLKEHLPVYINNLVQAFTKIGVKGCEKYVLPVSDKNPVAVTPSSSNPKVSPASGYRKKIGLKFKHNI